ncbi:hypothetical protein [Coleofasciculus sp. FACHB-SPT36]|nr:hypothetical protein [Coleofasciculus sp. FACHB-SPT36]MBD2538782.1 hypothetical protein [Coleofasciculus sp. FACHB-SPT36]
MLPFIAEPIDSFTNVRSQLLGFYWLKALSSLVFLSLTQELSDRRQG